MAEYFNKKLNPKILFLIDGFGALLSAFLLGVILVRFESSFGMPRKTLYFLAALPCFFVVYDFICYRIVGENWRPFLKAIAVANLMYCCVSVALLVDHYSKLTDLGVAYFLIEIVILIVLSGIELKIASKR